jgi:hypothetical protein
MKYFLFVILLVPAFAAAKTPKLKITLRVSRNERNRSSGWPISTI